MHSHALKGDWIFSTPITQFQSDWEDIDNKSLLSFLLEIEKKEKGTNFQYSMSGNTGYHTKNDLLKRDNKIIKKFNKMISETLNSHCEMITGKQLPENSKIEAWGMIYREGDFSATHQHPLSDLSGVYYLNVPKLLEAGSGELVFLDPRANAKFANFGGWDNDIVIPPAVGTGVIFPSWLEHYVRPHNVKHEVRVAVAFNLYIPKDDIETTKILKDKI